jgi:transposase-like protein
MRKRRSFSKAFKAEAVRLLYKKWGQIYFLAKT